MVRFGERMLHGLYLVALIGLQFHRAPGGSTARSDPLALHIIPASYRYNSINWYFLARGDLQKLPQRSYTYARMPYPWDCVGGSGDGSVHRVWPGTHASGNILSDWT